VLFNLYQATAAGSPADGSILTAGQYLDMLDSESETDLSGGSSDEELVEV